jgi:hypothetical protein
MLAEGKLSFVEERNLKPRIGSGAQLVLPYMYRRADGGGDGI